MAGTGVDAAAIRAAVDRLYELMLADPAFEGMWQNTDMTRLKSHQRAFLLRALGGPSLYSGRDMQTAHLGLGISDTQFTAMLVHLMTALREAGLSADVVERARSDVQKLRGLVVEHEGG